LVRSAAAWRLLCLTVAGSAIAVGLLLGARHVGSGTPARAGLVAASLHSHGSAHTTGSLLHPNAAPSDHPAKLPPVAQGDVVRVTIAVKEATLEIAPGVRYRAWTFDGHVPGPVLHVRQGQRVEVTFQNRGSVPHSFDIHAARIQADKAFKDVGVGGSVTFGFVARDPGVFLYHCVTAPAVAHIANGMFGAMVVDPETPLPIARDEFVLVASEWYLDRPGLRVPAQLDMQKALAMNPDWVTFNGYASQYLKHPLRVQPGDLVRFYVVNAGPNLVTPFHLVGGVFDRVYPDGDVTHPLTGVQTTDVPPGGGAIFDARFDQPGIYGFVSHSFANAEKGEIGGIAVGNVRGTLKH
jgi:nitrite reductase (NO-forming)